MASISQRTKGYAVKKFAQEMNAAIKDGRTTIAELIELTGLSRMQIYRLTRGINHPTLDTAEKIAKAIGVKISITRISA